VELLLFGNTNPLKFCQFSLIDRQPNDFANKDSFVDLIFQYFMELDSIDGYSTPLLSTY